MTTNASTISDEDLRAAVERARRLADPEPEPFRSLAFQTLLDYLIRTGPPAGAQPAAHLRPGLDLIETHPDRVLAIAYYQEKYVAGPPVTAHDLAEAYQRGRIKRPQNFPDVIASLVRKGLLVEQPRREGLKSWGITSTGAARVERELA
jgi:hypothetical protein